MSIVAIVASTGSHDKEFPVMSTKVFAYSQTVLFTHVAMITFNYTQSPFSICRTFLANHSYVYDVFRIATKLYENISDSPHRGENVLYDLTEDFQYLLILF